MRKMTYMIEKSPSLAAPWPFRWRKHAALGMTRPLWGGTRRYDQYDPVSDWIDQPQAGHSYDGLASNWHHEVGPAWFGDDQGFKLMKDDEPRVFADMVVNCALLLDETVIRDGRGAYRVFAMAGRAAGASEDAFDKRWAKYAEAALALPLGPTVRHMSISKRVDHEYTRNSKIPFAGMTEFCFDSPEAARLFFSADAYRKLAADYTDAVRVDEQLVLTKENVFYDEDHGVDMRDRMIATYLMGLPERPASPL